jgi:hypothetical protein
VRWFWSSGKAYAIAATVLCVGLFIAALIAGQGPKSFEVLAASIAWLLIARLRGQRARAAHRHRELRRRRHQRMRDGTWSGPHRDD